MFASQKKKSYPIPSDQARNEPVGNPAHIVRVCRIFRQEPFLQNGAPKIDAAAQNKQQAWGVMPIFLQILVNSSIWSTLSDMTTLFMCTRWSLHSPYRLHCRERLLSERLHILSLWRPAYLNSGYDLAANHV